MQKQFEIWFVLLIPLINAVADVSIYLTPEGAGINTGIIRGAIMLTFLFYFLFRRFRFVSVSKVILIFLIYLFLLVLLSSDFNNSFFNGYIKWLVAMMMFPVGFYYIRDIDTMKRLLIVYVLASVVISGNFIFAQIYKVGISAYVEESFYTGGGGVGLTNSLSIILIVSPVLLSLMKSRVNLKALLIYVSLIAALLFVFIAMKRSAIIGLGVGMLFYTYNSSKKRLLFRYYLILSIAIGFSYRYFEDVLTTRYQAREEQFISFEKDYRQKEFYYVIDEMYEKPIIHSLFGSEMFNSRQFFGPKYFKQHRMIHGDMSSFLNGAGIVGLLLYLGIFLRIFKDNLRLNRALTKQQFTTELNAVVLGLLFCTVFISATGSGTIGERSLVYLFIGAAFGLRSQLISDNIHSEE